MSLLQPILDQISKLWARVNGMPTMRWGTVTVTSPLRIRLDGDTDEMPVSPATAAATIPQGARVLCVEQNRRVTVLASPEMRALHITDSGANGRAYFGTGPDAWGTGSTYMGLSPVSDGVANAMWINYGGTEVFRVTKDGHIDTPGIPYAAAQGAATVTPVANTPTSVTVTLPPGRFTQPPGVQATVNTSVPGTISRDATIGTRTTTSFVLWYFRTDTSATGITWTAIQMTRGSAYG